MSLPTAVLVKAVLKDCESQRSSNAEHALFCPSTRRNNLPHWRSEWLPLACWGHIPSKAGLLGAGILSKNPSPILPVLPPATLRG